MKTSFKEHFNLTQISSDLTWFNQPSNWKLDSGFLVINPDKTDFWQKTHYSFSYDNGHCLFYRVPGDFSLTTQVHFFPKTQYDQAGLMIRINQDFWIKTSVEYEDQTLSRLGVVVTNFGYSDWSTQDFDPNIHEITLRISKTGPDYQVSYYKEDTDWSQLRIAHLHQEAEILHCGLYACSPIKTGFQAKFKYLKIDPN